jgi:hypothetical protein
VETLRITEYIASITVRYQYFGGGGGVSNVTSSQHIDVKQHGKHKGSTQETRR